MASSENRQTNWQLLGSSSLPLAELKFGDVDGDGSLDVIGRNSGHWAWSRSGRTAWQLLNPSIGTSLANCFVADVDGDGKADIVQLVARGLYRGTWQWSRNGRTPWIALADVGTEPPSSQTFRPDAEKAFTVGRFDQRRGADLLFLDLNRRAVLTDVPDNTTTPWGSYAY